VRNVTIWGNHSSTQYPDVRHASVTLDGTNYKPVREVVNDDNWLHGEFITVRRVASFFTRQLSSTLTNSYPLWTGLNIDESWCVFDQSQTSQLSSSFDRRG
jgi:hypothetical protein